MDVKRLQHTQCERVMTAQLMEGGFGSVVHVMAVQLQVRQSADFCFFMNAACPSPSDEGH